MAVELSFKQKSVTIVFDHKYSPPGEKTSRAKSIMHIEQDKELPFFFEVLQAINPEEVKKLVTVLKTKLENESFDDFQRSILEYAVKALSRLASKNLLLARSKEQDDE